MTKLKNRLNELRDNFDGPPSEDHWLELFQRNTIREFVREVNRKVEAQRIGAPEAIQDTLKELGIEL